MVTLERCLKDGLLKAIPPSPIEAKNQFAKAVVILAEAKSCLENGDINAAVIAAYAALFDAARAILFNDGYRERSHVCVVRYLEKYYMKELTNDVIILLDEYRDRRHHVVYDSDYYATESEAGSIVSFAEKFIQLVDKIKPEIKKYK